MWSAWQCGHRISIQMSLLSAGSVREVSWAPWPPRPPPLPNPIQRASFQPTASVSCHRVNWKKGELKCGSVCITSLWSSQSPVKARVRKGKGKSKEFTVTKNWRRHFFTLSQCRLHQETVCVWDHQRHFSRSGVDPRMWNDRFLPPQHISHLAEAQRGGTGWWRGGSDRGRGAVGPHPD